MTDAPTQAKRNSNTGHGHVYLRPDGNRMRCGGPGICAKCAKDLAELQEQYTRTPSPAAATVDREAIARTIVKSDRAWNADESITQDWADFLADAILSALTPAPASAAVTVKFKSVEDFRNAWTNCMSYMSDGPDFGLHTDERVMHMCMSRFISALTPAPVAGWRDMESAPRDGTDVLVHTVEGIDLAWWANGSKKWMTRDGTYVPAEPDAWMPLPPSPGQPASEGPDAVQEVARVKVDDVVKLAHSMTGQPYDEFGEWIECWDCGGEGTYGDMCQCEDFEDTCCCLHPTPKRCSTCRGKGGWKHVDKQGDTQ